VVSVLATDRVEVAWPVSDRNDLAGYHLERAVVEVLTEDQLRRLKAQTPPLAEPSVGALRRIGAFTRITPTPVVGTSFVDATVDLKQPAVLEGEPLFERQFDSEQFDPNGRVYRFGVYAYRVRAVSAGGLESGPSPVVLTIPSSPQFLFAREEGTTCHLRWASNPERGIRGYRVYRLNGRYDKDPIVRMPTDSLAEKLFSDPAAGTATRRYYVVAVDALGQEGFPSSPVWFNREWQSFYRPFVGEWHQ
jgi:hypothetical protein